MVSKNRKKTIRESIKKVKKAVKKQLPYNPIRGLKMRMSEGKDARDAYKSERDTEFIRLAQEEISKHNFDEQDIQYATQKIMNSTFTANEMKMYLGTRIATYFALGLLAMKGYFDATNAVPLAEMAKEAVPMKALGDFIIPMSCGMGSLLVSGLDAENTYGKITDKQY